MLYNFIEYVHIYAKDIVRWLSTSKSILKYVWLWVYFLFFFYCRLIFFWKQVLRPFIHSIDSPKWQQVVDSLQWFHLDSIHLVISYSYRQPFICVLFSKQIHIHQHTYTDFTHTSEFTSSVERFNKSISVWLECIGEGVCYVFAYMYFDYLWALIACPSICCFSYYYCHCCHSCF